MCLQEADKGVLNEAAKGALIRVHQRCAYKKLPMVCL